MAAYHNLEIGRTNFRLTTWPVKNQSDGRVDRASASGSVDSGFDYQSSQTNDLKIGIHSFPTTHSALKGQR